jgi:hypothetical protein
VSVAGQACDVFGAKRAGTIYGAMLTAWSAGAIAGPILIAIVPHALLLIAGILALASALPVLFHVIVQRSVRIQPVRGPGRSRGDRMKVAAYMSNVPAGPAADPVVTCSAEHQTSAVSPLRLGQSKRGPQIVDVQVRPFRRLLRR